MLGFKVPIKFVPYTANKQPVQGGQTQIIMLQRDLQCCNLYKKNIIFYFKSDRNPTTCPN